MTDIVLINSPLTEDKITTMLPLGCLALGSYLESQGIDVVIIDGNAFATTPQKIAQLAIEYNPSWIGVSVMTDCMLPAMKMLHHFKSYPHIKTVVGGVHISATGNNLGSNYRICGEGETALNQLITNGSITAEIIHDLDALPFLNYNLIRNFSIYDYTTPSSLVRPEASLIFSRGCPYRCTFCNVNTTFGTSYRVRSVESAVNEIQQKQADYGARFFVFKDSTFLIDKDWVSRFCERIITKKLRIQWKCNVRIDSVLPNVDLFRLMHRAGCTTLSIGLESGSQSVLDMMKKGYKVGIVQESMTALTRLGFITHVSMMMGCPGDTKSTIVDTIGLAKKAKAFFTTFYVATPYPKTGFYEWGLKNGCVKPEWWLEGSKVGGIYALDLDFNGKMSFPDFDPTKAVYSAYRQYYFSLEFLVAAARVFRHHPLYFLRILFIYGVEFLWALLRRVH